MIRLPFHRTYLAGPINGCTDDQARGWRAQAAELLRAGGLFDSEILDPMVRDYRGVESANVAQIVEQDKADIDSCRFLLVYFEKPSVGTSMEVIYAHERKLTVVIVDRSDRPLSPWLIYHSHFVCKTLEEAVDYICSSLPKTE